MSDITPEEILAAVATVSGTSVGYILDQNRTPASVLRRQAAGCMIRNICPNLSLENIADILKRDHYSTAHHAIIVATHAIRYQPETELAQLIHRAHKHLKQVQPDLNDLDTSAPSSPEIPHIMMGLSIVFGIAQHQIRRPRNKNPNYLTPVARDLAVALMRTWHNATNKQIRQTIHGPLKNHADLYARISEGRIHRRYIGKLCNHLRIPPQNIPFSGQP